MLQTGQQSGHTRLGACKCALFGARHRSPKYKSGINDTDTPPPSSSKKKGKPWAKTWWIYIYKGLYNPSKDVISVHILCYYFWKYILYNSSCCHLKYTSISHSCTTTPYYSNMVGVVLHTLLITGFGDRNAVFFLCPMSSQSLSQQKLS